MEYSIKLNDKQVAILVRALDLFSRIGIGQLERIEEEVRWYMPGKKIPAGAAEEVQKNIASLKRLLFQQAPTSSYSICNEQDVDVAYREAYDMLQVLRHRLAWDKNPDGNKMCVDYDEPVKWVPDFPPIKIEKEKC